MNKIHLAVVCFALFLSLTGPAFADELFLVNGDRISGMIIRQADGFLLVKTDYAEELRIVWDSIVALDAAEPLQILLKDEQIVRARMVVSDTAQAGDGAIAKHTVRQINPPSYLSGDGALWTGRFELGMSSSEGNTDTQDVHASGEVTARTRPRRYKLSGVYNWATDSGRETESNLEGIGKLDHFFTKKWFGFFRTALYKDRFKDLNLRAVVGSGAGYQFIESARENLFVQGGIDYVLEDYGMSEDNEYPAARWDLAYDVLLHRGKVQIFHKHGLNISLEDTKDVLLETETGLRLPITPNLSSAFQVDFDWDNSPAADTNRSDTKYILSIGYGW